MDRKDLAIKLEPGVDVHMGTQTTYVRQKP